MLFSQKKKSDVFARAREGEEACHQTKSKKNLPNLCLSKLSRLIPWFNQDEDIIIAKIFSILGQVASQIEQELFKLEEALKGKHKKKGNVVLMIILRTACVLGHPPPVTGFFSWDRA